MPWLEKKVEMLRKEFIDKSKEEDRNFSALCREYGISRKTGYKWVNRYQETKSVEDKSRRPKNCSKTDTKTEKQIMELREKRPGWGARKIQVHLVQKGYQMPSIRTVNNILKRNGYISPEASLARKPFKRFERKTNNELWQADFKGDFRMKDGNRCYPLTILDDHSRFALCIHPKTHQREIIHDFVEIFRKYGLPEAILTDNGPTFAGFRNGYTQFERVLMEQNILPIHGRVYHPQTQGKIERFHRSMKEELLKYCNFQDLLEAEETFTKWKYIYNFERPHEALSDRCPAQVYSPSNREFCEKIPNFDYGSEFRLYLINNWGYLRFAKYQLYISETFRKTYVQLIPDGDNDLVLVRFHNFIIAKIDIISGKLVSRKAYRYKPLYT